MFFYVGILEERDASLDDTGRDLEKREEGEMLESGSLGRERDHDPVERQSGGGGKKERKEPFFHTIDLVGLHRCVAAVVHRIFQLAAEFGDHRCAENQPRHGSAAGRAGREIVKVLREHGFGSCELNCGREAGMKFAITSFIYICKESLTNFRMRVKKDWFDIGEIM